MECRIGLHSNQLTKKNCAIGCAAQAGFQTYPKHDWRECIMQPTSAPLMGAVSRPALVYTPAVRDVVDRFGFSALASVRPTIALVRTPRCPRTSGHRLLPLRRWLCSSHRRTPERPCDTPCRTKHRNESWAIPSLFRVTPSATSERLLGLLGSTPIPP